MLSPKFGLNEETSQSTHGKYVGVGMVEVLEAAEAEEFVDTGKEVDEAVDGFPRV